MCSDERRKDLNLCLVMVFLAWKGGSIPPSDHPMVWGPLEFYNSSPYPGDLRKPGHAVGHRGSGKMLEHFL